MYFHGGYCQKLVNIHPQLEEFDWNPEPPLFSPSKASLVCNDTSLIPTINPEDSIQRPASLATTLPQYYPNQSYPLSHGETNLRDIMRAI